jgi:hypothetical protein
MPRKHTRERRYSSTVFDIGTWWRWVVSFTSRRFTPSERAPLDRKLARPQSRSGCCGEQTNLLPSPELNPGRPAHSPSQYWFSSPGSCSRYEHLSKMNNVLRFAAQYHGSIMWAQTVHSLGKLAVNAVNIEMRGRDGMNPIHGLEASNLRERYCKNRAPD